MTVPLFGIGGVSLTSAAGAAAGLLVAALGVVARAFDEAGFQLGSSARYLRYISTALRNRLSYVARLWSFRSILLFTWNRRSIRLGHVHHFTLYPGLRRVEATVLDAVRASDRYTVSNTLVPTTGGTATLS